MNGFTKQATSKICLILNELGNALKGRLPSSTVEFALNYIPHNEFGLAFETLCDYIDEFNVEITNDEYQSILHIANLIDYNDSYNRMRNLCSHVI